MLSLRNTFAHVLSAALAASALLLFVACGGGGAPDPKPPSNDVLRLDRTFANFRSEAGLTVAVDGGGNAIVPASYQYASGDRITVDHGDAITKTATRLGWSGALTAGDLEGENTPNIPALRVVVPYGRHYTVTSALATVTVTCQGCTPTEQAVDLSSWPSTLAGTSSEQYFLLPLASNTIPALAALPAGTTQVQLEISAEATLAAGSVASTDAPWEVAIDLVGPPLAVTENAGYNTVPEARSAAYYRTSNANYTQLFEIGPFAIDTGVRLFHYVVTNPAPVETAVQVSLPAGSWGLSEHWIGYDRGDHSATFTTSCGGSGIFTPCSSNQVYWQPAGGTWSCASSSTHSATTLPAAATATHSLTGTPFPKGFVGAVAVTPTEGGKRFRVPAASGGTPGRLDLYVERPIVTAPERTGFPALSWDTTTYTAGSFTVLYETVIRYISAATNQCNQSAYATTYTWSGNIWGRRLASASELVNGTLALSATSTNGVGALKPVASFDLSGKVISH